MQIHIQKWPLAILGFCVVVALATPRAAAATLDMSDVESCDQHLVPKKMSKNGKLIGQELCRMRSVDFEFLGRKFRRVEMGVTGTVEGYTLKDDSARYANYLNEYPEFVYPQAGEQDQPVFHAVGRYSMTTGHMVTVIYPLDKSQWNGKLFLHNHGAGRSFARGNAKSWEEEFDPTGDPLQKLGRYQRSMIEKGYVLAQTFRSTLMQGGDVTVTTDDGTVLQNRNLTEQPTWIMGMAKLAGNLVQARLGAQPQRTYWYGHSGGARPGRMVNYKEGINVDSDGTPIIDGIIVDDAGSGLWVPIVMKDGKNVLFDTDAEKKGFVPMIEVSHLLYVNETPDDPPAWRGGNNFLANKRINAKTLMDKGLGNKFRYYEIDGVSHSGPGATPTPADRIGNTLDIDLLMESFMDVLDAWVENGVAPPPNRSDWRPLGDADHDNLIENAAIDMPEVTCPLGVFHIYGNGTASGSTQYKPFATSPFELEPLDGRGEFRDEPDTVNVAHGFVDMNGNGYRDFVETATEAWQRVGLIKPNESFNRERYVQCVRDTSNKLISERFFMSRTLDKYLQKARTMSLPEK